MKTFSPHMCSKCNEPLKLVPTDDFENYPFGIKVMNFDGKNIHDCVEREKLK